MKKGSLVGCLIYIYRFFSYPIIWGLVLINHEISGSRTINQPGFFMESKGPGFFSCLSRSPFVSFLRERGVL